MGFLNRLLRGPAPPTAVSGDGLAMQRADVAPARVDIRRQQVATYGGHETLEVVGESHYQHALWQIIGHAYSRANPVRYDVVALLIPEPDNPYDANAVRVVVDEFLVGYLSRSDAARYQPSVLRLMQGTAALVGLRGQIVGRGGDDGLGLLGVFLDHDPADFGLPSSHVGALRTGLGETAHSWWGHLNGDTLHDVTELRRLLKTEVDALDRHYMWARLERLIYRSRDTFASAITEYDDVCEQHHAEMGSIRPALLAEFGGIPLLELYRQQAIRWKKAHDWEKVIAWSERGLAIYQADAARPEDLDDLHDRLAYARGKVEPVQPQQPRRASHVRAQSTVTIEVLVCTGCGKSFSRARSRGRKPHLCPSCRDSQPV
jgi:hypothetical protein